MARLKGSSESAPSRLTFLGRKGEHFFLCVDIVAGSDQTDDDHKGSYDSNDHDSDSDNDDSDHNVDNDIDDDRDADD